MERALNTRKTDIEIVVCKLVFENGNTGYFCRLFDMRDKFALDDEYFRFGKFAEASRQALDLDGLAVFAVERLREFLDRNHPFGDWFAIRFPQESIGIANVYCQLLLYQGLSSEEQAEFFRYFAREFKEHGLHRYCDKRPRAGMYIEV